MFSLRTIIVVTRLDDQFVEVTYLNGLDERQPYIMSVKHVANPPPPGLVPADIPPVGQTYTRVFDHDLPRSS